MEVAGVEMIYIDAPIRLAPYEVADPFLRRFTWCLHDPRDNHRRFVGKFWGEAVLHLRDAFASLGPFDGLLGYSQGAVAAALVAAMRDVGAFPSFIGFAVLVAAYQPTKHRDALTVLVRQMSSSKRVCSGLTPEEIPRSRRFFVPTLHFSGRADRTSPPKMNLAFAKMFDNAVIFEHLGGHRTPFHTAGVRAMLDFLGKYSDTLESVRIESLEKEVCSSCANWSTPLDGGGRNEGAEHWYCGHCWSKWERDRLTGGGESSDEFEDARR